MSEGFDILPFETVNLNSPISPIILLQSQPDESSNTKDFDVKSLHSSDDEYDLISEPEEKSNSDVFTVANSIVGEKKDSSFETPDQDQLTPTTPNLSLLQNLAIESKLLTERAEQLEERTEQLEETCQNLKQLESNYHDLQVLYETEVSENINGRRKIEGLDVKLNDLMVDYERVREEKDLGTSKIVKLKRVVLENDVANVKLEREVLENRRKLPILSFELDILKLDYKRVCEENLSGVVKIERLENEIQTLEDMFIEEKSEKNNLKLALSEAKSNFVSALADRSLAKIEKEKDDTEKDELKKVTCGLKANLTALKSEMKAIESERDEIYTKLTKEVSRRKFFEKQSSEFLKTSASTESVASQSSVPTVESPIITAYLDEVQALINTLLDKIESRPELISILLISFEGSLATRNWGLTILPPLEEPTHQALEETRPEEATQPTRRHSEESCCSSSTSGTWASKVAATIPHSQNTSSSKTHIPFSENKMESKKLVNWRLECHSCNEIIKGTRYKCGDCPEYSLCEKCNVANEISNGEVHGHGHSFVALDDPTKIWHGIVCDECGVKNFGGERFKCNSCADYDVCKRCHDELNDEDDHFTSHTFKRMKEPAVKWHTVVCDGCETPRMEGPRFKCGSCEDYDLCKRCIENGQDFTHNIKHIDSDSGQHDFIRLDTPSDLWSLVRCDNCQTKNMAGVRWKCACCSDYDLCQTCYGRFEEGKIMGCSRPSEGADGVVVGKHPFIKLFPRSHVKECVRTQIKGMGFVVTEEVEEHLEKGVGRFGNDEEAFVLWMVDRL